MQPRISPRRPSVFRPGSHPVVRRDPPRSPSTSAVTFAIRTTRRLLSAPDDGARRQSGLFVHGRLRLAPVAGRDTPEGLTARRARTRPPDPTGSRARSSSRPARRHGPAWAGGSRFAGWRPSRRSCWSRTPIRKGRSRATASGPGCHAGPLHLGDPPGRTARLHHARHGGVHEERYKRPLLERSFRRGNKTRFVRCLRWRGTDLRPVRFASRQQPAGFEKAFPRDRRGA